jgi:hypothetical protein
VFHVEHPEEVNDRGAGLGVMFHVEPNDAVKPLGGTHATLHAQGRLPTRGGVRRWFTDHYDAADPSQFRRESERDLRRAKASSHHSILRALPPRLVGELGDIYRESRDAF